jgi:hypothetical protein
MAMKTLLLSSLISFLLIGCSSSAPTNDPDQFKNYTGGSAVGDATNLYWFTERLAFPHTAADYVTAGDYGWYKSDYRWEEGKLRELIREGEQRSDDFSLVPYRIHVRFNQEGSAIYQQYRLDGKILPLKSEKIAWLRKEASNIPTTTKQQRDNGTRLIQGYWDGSSFDTCDGRSYGKLEFNQTLPSFVVNRLASVDSYTAFLGSVRGSSVVVSEMLMLADDDYDCIERPSLIEE